MNRRTVLAGTAAAMASPFLTAVPSLADARRQSLVDQSLWQELGDFKPTGVNERLVQKVRDALDRDGFERIKIVVSGGFTAEKISSFEAQGVPVDAYGVGSSLIRGANDFTADVVMTDGQPSGKFGRHLRDNPRLELVS